MNYQKPIILLLLIVFAFCESGCQQAQQTDFNTYGHKKTPYTNSKTDTNSTTTEKAELKPDNTDQPVNHNQQNRKIQQENWVPQDYQAQQDRQSQRENQAQQDSQSQRENQSQQNSIPPGDSNNHMLLGNPSSASVSMADADNYLIDHTYYVESYSRAKAQPNWVSWHLDEDDLGNAGRTNNFRPDITLPKGWYKADDTSYKNSGFDKGHNCPSGDRTSSTAANNSTFLMNNIIPQAPNNNQKTWEHLESYCRAQVKRGNEAYVIMGSYGTGGTGKNGYAESIDKGRINVPARIWKVVILIPKGNNDLQRINANTRVIAIDTPNDNKIIPNWMSYLCTVRDIEKATGYDLFSALPKSIQDRIEIQKFKGGN